MARYLKINGKVCLDTRRSMFCNFLFSPHHLINYPHITLDNFHYLGRDILVYIIRNWYSMLSIFAEFYGGIHCLREALLVDTGDDEVAFVDSLWTFRGGTDADGREGMAYTGEETAFLRECTAVADYGEGIHLKAVVIVEA